MKTKSLWLDAETVPKFQTLASDLDVDVAIVGGGITGLTAAYLLSQAGKTVAILEKGHLLSGETGFTTAHLTAVLDEPYHRLFNQLGEEKAITIAASHLAAIDFIEARVIENKIGCSFKRVDGYIYTEVEEQLEEMEKQLAGLQRVGLSPSPTKEMPLPFPIKEAIKIPNQGQFHPVRYLRGILDLCVRQNVQIYDDTKVVEVHEGKPCRIQTTSGEVTARDVIVAANVPINNRLFLQTKIASYRTYAIAARVRGLREAVGLFWDLEDPYHYLRSFTSGEDRYLILGGEDHKTGMEEHTEAKFDLLSEYLFNHFDVIHQEYQWSGQIIEPVDGIAFIGKNTLSEHVYVSTGYSGNGMTYGTLAAIQLAEQILGRENPWKNVYDATRLPPLSTAPDYLAENKDYPICLVTDRFTKTVGADEIEANQGGIVYSHGEKVAVFRDTNGELHAFSPVCPHLGCYVRWNLAERTWDCPCHGSRFSCQGQVLNGPAVSNLRQIDLPVEDEKKAV
jgi:glycine/D-amino acid oxidase-like deaminating enzyme/nitrite reductase/ring-hydroxylating ferredoxin subunit